MLGASQLKQVDKFLAARRSIVGRYESAFSKISQLILPREETGVRSAWHLYPVRLQGDLAARRGKIFASLRAAGVGAQVHFIPVYWHPYYQKLGYAMGMCPRAEQFYESELSLPVFPGLKRKDQDFVIKTVKQIVAGV